MRKVACQYWAGLLPDDFPVIGVAEVTLGFSAWTGGGIDGTEGGVGRAGLGRDGGDGGEGSFGSEGTWAGVTWMGMAHSQR